MKKAKPVVSYARMWPRELFDCKHGKQLVVRELEILSQPGVYVLYRNDVPYYVGQAKKLRSRLWSHANQPASKYYNFWNYFSAFAVEDPIFRSQVEGVLIAAMPTANGAKPRIRKAQLPSDVRRYLHKRLHQPIQLKAMAMQA
ncbi:MAG: GIY-YIG nuclease family protein [Acidobacteriia bacterium]|nr:GIY-YIG nuclease family protein [Terriglobia bacterium]